VCREVGQAASAGGAQGGALADQRGDGDPRRTAINRAVFDNKHWRPALTRAGIEPTRATGTHALRHFYASALLDAGESVKALAEYLGHSDPAFTLRVYTHLMPASEKRARRAIDDRRWRARP
jgi:integrase